MAVDYIGAAIACANAIASCGEERGRSITNDGLPPGRLSSLQRWNSDDRLSGADWRTHRESHRLRRRSVPSGVRCSVDRACESSAVGKETDPRWFQQLGTARAREGAQERSRRCEDLSSPVGVEANQRVCRTRESEKIGELAGSLASAAGRIGELAVRLVEPQLALTSVSHDHACISESSNPSHLRERLAIDTAETHQRRTLDSPTTLGDKVLCIRGDANTCAVSHGLRGTRPTSSCGQSNRNATKPPTERSACETHAHLQKQNGSRHLHADLLMSATQSVQLSDLHHGARWDILSGWGRRCKGEPKAKPGMSRTHEASTCT